MNIVQIHADIKRLLLNHGAQRIMEDYEDGKMVGISFIIPTSKGLLPIKMPARWEKVAKIMYGTLDLSEERLNQAYRTAWKNIHDWLDAQIALIETDMVKMEEVFLPYLLQKGGRTVYETLQDRNFLLPEGNR